MVFRKTNHYDPYRHSSDHYHYYHDRSPMKTSTDVPKDDSLRDSLVRLIEMLTDKSLWNFLSDKERQIVSDVISRDLAA